MFCDDKINIEFPKGLIFERVVVRLLNVMCWIGIFHEITGQLTILGIEWMCCGIK
jgi:hypothetical protein